MMNSVKKNAVCFFFPKHQPIFFVDQWKNNSKNNKNYLVNFKNAKTYFYLFIFA